MIVKEQLYNKAIIDKRLGEGLWRVKQNESKCSQFISFLTNNATKQIKHQQQNFNCTDRNYSQYPLHINKFSPIDIALLQQCQSYILQDQKQKLSHSSLQTVERQQGKKVQFVADFIKQANQNDEAINYEQKQQQQNQFLQVQQIADNKDKNNNKRNKDKNINKKCHTGSSSQQQPSISLNYQQQQQQQEYFELQLRIVQEKQGMVSCADRFQFCESHQVKVCKKGRTGNGDKVNQRNNSNNNNSNKNGFTLSNFNSFSNNNNNNNKNPQNSKENIKFNNQHSLCKQAAEKYQQEYQQFYSNQLVFLIKKIELMYQRKLSVKGVEKIVNQLQRLAGISELNNGENGNYGVQKYDKANVIVGQQQQFSSITLDNGFNRRKKSVNNNKINQKQTLQDLTIRINNNNNQNNVKVSDNRLKEFNKIYNKHDSNKKDKVLPLKQYPANTNKKRQQILQSDHINVNKKIRFCTQTELPQKQSKSKQKPSTINKTKLSSMNDNTTKQPLSGIYASKQIMRAQNMKQPLSKMNESKQPTQNNKQNSVIAKYSNIIKGPNDRSLLLSKDNKERSFSPLSYRVLMERKRQQKMNEKNNQKSSKNIKARDKQHHTNYSILKNNNSISINANINAQTDNNKNSSSNNTFLYENTYNPNNINEQSDYYNLSTSKEDDVQFQYNQPNSRNSCGHQKAKMTALKILLQQRAGQSGGLLIHDGDYRAKTKTLTFQYQQNQQQQQILQQIHLYCQQQQISTKNITLILNAVTNRKPILTIKAT